ncbi:MAG: hypothetical protein MZV70_03685 [Desulfobacterales bacterium]|nr:hypothetical protein [Desulfobacterales bacterium]
MPHGNSVEKNAAMRALGVELIEHGDDLQSAREFRRNHRPASGRCTWCPPSTPAARGRSGHLQPGAAQGRQGHRCRLMCPSALGPASAACPRALEDAVDAQDGGRGSRVGARTAAYAASFGARRPDHESPANTRLADGVACRTPEPAAAPSSSGKVSTESSR